MTHTTGSITRLHITGTGPIPRKCECPGTAEQGVIWRRRAGGAAPRASWAGWTRGEFTVAAANAQCEAGQHAGARRHDCTNHRHQSACPTSQRRWPAYNEAGRAPEAIHALSTLQAAYPAAAHAVWVPSSARLEMEIAFPPLSCIAITVGRREPRHLGRRL